jgi:hypothetical protein
MSWRRPALRARRHGGAAPDAALPRLKDDQPAARQEHGCGCTLSGLPALRELAPDVHEALAISLIRFVFAGYFSGRLDAWDHGFEAAEHVLGSEAGTLFFCKVLALGRAVKAERLGDFNFLPSHCDRIAEDEAVLLAALQSARGGEGASLEEAMLNLSRQIEAPRLRKALSGLTCLIGQVGQATAPAQEAAPRPVPRSRMH